MIAYQKLIATFVLRASMYDERNMKSQCTKVMEMITIYQSKHSANLKCSPLELFSLLMNMYVLRFFMY